MSAGSPQSQPSGKTSVVDRLFDGSLLLAILAVCGFAFSLLRAEPDLWGHVQYGRDALQEGLYRTTTYSFTAEGYRWINHENLSELLFASVVDRQGVWALLAGKILLGLGIVATMLWHAHRQGVSTIVLAVSMLLVCVNLTGFWFVRPQVLSYTLFAALVALLSFGFAGWRDQWHLPWTSWLARRDRQQTVSLDARRVRCLWAAAILFVVWVNTHGAFLAGLCIFAAYVVLRAVEIAVSRHTPASSNRRRTVVGLMVLAVGVAVATLLNPYGVKLHVWLLESLTIPRPEIVEWHPLRWGDEPFVPFALLAAATALGLLLSRRSLDATQLVVLGVTFWQATSHQRHVPFFAILCGFWLPLHWQSVWQRFQAHRDAEKELSQRAKIAAAGGLVMVALLVAACLFTRCRQLPVERTQYPVSALEYVAKQKIQGRLVVTYNWAQYAIAALGVSTDDQPTSRVSFDGRFRTCYPLDMVDKHFDFILGNHPAIPRYRSPESPAADPAAILREGDPELVLVSRRQPHSVQVMEQNQHDWTLLYQDQVAQLWGRSTKYGDQHSRDYIAPAARDTSQTPQSGSVAWPALPVSE